MLTVNAKSQAVTKIRNMFREKNVPLTLKQINNCLPELMPTQISSTLCYLMRQRYVVREHIENPTPKSRSQVWQYTYSDTKYPQEVQP
jgi:hypothetical protein